MNKGGMSLFFPSTNRRNKGHAQVLLEVIAAVALVSVALTAITGSLIGNYKAAVVVREYTKALFLLEDQGQSLLLSGAGDAASTERACSPRAGAYQCRTDVSELRDPLRSGLQQVTSSVSWESRKKVRKLEMSSLIEGIR